jgi:hypothetical protein
MRGKVHGLGRFGGGSRVTRPRLRGRTMHDDDWMASQGENVFEMYVAHGGPGFWVRRITWGDTCARVVRVGRLTKPGPYFGNPSVLVDVYSLVVQIQHLVPKFRCRKRADSCRSPLALRTATWLIPDVLELPGKPGLRPTRRSYGDNSINIDFFCPHE